MDDILVFGKGETQQEEICDRDENRQLQINRMIKLNIELNRNKINFVNAEVECIGHVVTTPMAVKSSDKSVRNQ